MRIEIFKPEELFVYEDAQSFTIHESSDDHRGNITVDNYGDPELCDTYEYTHIVALFIDGNLRFFNEHLEIDNSFMSMLETALEGSKQLS